MDDLISRQAAIDAVWKIDAEMRPSAIDAIIKTLKQLPSAQPLIEEFEWCTDCKEYDQKAHCCHRFTKVIRQTVEELKAQPQRMRGRWEPKIDRWGDTLTLTEGYNCSECHAWVDGKYSFCPWCGADMREGDT